MNYKVITEKVVRGEQMVAVDLPLGYEDTELTDKMVRKEASSDFNGKIALDAGEHVKEVWREGVRIYPRAVSNGRKKKSGPKTINASEITVGDLPDASDITAGKIGGEKAKAKDNRPAGEPPWTTPTKEDVA